VRQTGRKVRFCQRSLHLDPVLPEHKRSSSSPSVSPPSDDSVAQRELRYFEKPMFLTHELTPASNDNLNRTVRENHSRAGLYSSDFQALGRAESTPLASVPMLCCAP
jgi:hypothetical protein